MRSWFLILCQSKFCVLTGEAVQCWRCAGVAEELLGSLDPLLLSGCLPARLREGLLALLDGRVDHILSESHESVLCAFIVPVSARFFLSLSEDPVAPLVALEPYPRTRVDPSRGIWRDRDIEVPSSGSSCTVDFDSLPPRFILRICLLVFWKLLLWCWFIYDVGF